MYSSQLANAHECTDEELLLHITFMQAVRISAIKLEGPSDQAPASLRLFSNRMGIDFETAKDEEPTQELFLSAAAVSPSSRPLDMRFVKFQNVTTLSIFVPSNLGGGEETVISKLIIIGEPVLQEGAKRSKEEQEASMKGDWLGSGIKGA